MSVRFATSCLWNPIYQVNGLAEPVFPSSRLKTGTKVGLFSPHYSYGPLGESGLASTSPIHDRQRAVPECRS
jgi:hypothetical protein